MEPEIRYARTSDGLNIAYYAMGEGLTLIVAASDSPASPISREWKVAQMRAVGRDRVPRLMQYVRYDPRGVGLVRRVPGHLHDRRAAP